MSRTLNNYRAYWNFRKIKKQLPPPKACNTISETQYCINTLNQVIATMKKEFGEAPDIAYFAIKDYIQAQDRLVLKDMEIEFND